MIDEFVQNLTLSANGDEVIKATAAYCKNTIVVLHIPGPTLVEEWIDHPNVTAVLAAWLPGEQSGLSLTSLLWGDVSPSGKLVFTIGKSESDYPVSASSRGLAMGRTNLV